MTYFRSICIVFFISYIVFSAGNSLAQQQEDRGRSGAPGGWSSFARGGAVYQFDADLDEGGSYDVKRFTFQAGQGYGWDPRTSVSLALGYSYDGYSFSRGSGIGAAAPWEDVHSFSLGVPMRKGIGDDWSAFLIPSVQSSGESGSSFDETITGGVLTGVAYRFGEHLTIGPGVGVVSQLEDSATIFPVLIIDWKITDTLSLETGRGLGASMGPGLTLNYRADRNWSFSVGGRYEKVRFRLDDRGTVPGGIGEDRSFPLYAGFTYSYSPEIKLSFVGGVEFGAELAVEDSDGNRIMKESSDPGGFLGFTFSFRK